ncbi:MAG: cupredoxin domain-containing protein [Pseudolabrys sp.]|jgi:plastocyanin
MTADISCGEQPMRYARSRPLLSAFVAVPLMIVASNSDAAEPVFHLTIVNQAFKPDSLSIPAGQRVKIMVMNKDTIPAEFESSDAHREVVIPGKTELPVYVGPLEPGTYHFFNDFHPDSKGTLTVKKMSQ